MVLSETLIVVLLMAFGLLLLKKGYEDRVFLHSFIATSLFLVGILLSLTVPFSVNGTGQVIGTASNLALAGLNLLFGFLALIVSILNAYALIGKLRTGQNPQA